MTRAVTRSSRSRRGVRLHAARVFTIAVIVCGIAAAIIRLPPMVVERTYGVVIYPALQSRLTAWSNQTSVALFDPLLAASVLALVLAWVNWIRIARQRRSVRPLGQGLLTTAAVLATFYLWFLAVWGLNYARPPLETVIDYDAAQVTPAALLRLGERAVDELNRRHASAHSAGFHPLDAIPAPLVDASRAVQGELGRAPHFTPGRPKRTMLGMFFRASGVDGMHAPFLLETLLNPDLTAAERPAVLAHEWAHMAGHAPEADASYVGLLAALRADAGSQYSAWLAIFDHVTPLLPERERQRIVSALESGPRADRTAIMTRMRSRVESVSRVSWRAYDGYLKSQGVREGLQSYGRVVDLLLGSGALDRTSPR